MIKEFTTDQINLIQNKLDQIQFDNICINKNQLFKLIPELGVEEYQFNLYLTKAVRENKIHGYQIKTGRSGGLQKVI